MNLTTAFRWTVPAVVVLTIAGCSSSSSTSTSTSTPAPTTRPSPTTPPSTRPRARLEFREVFNEYRKSGGPCRIPPTSRAVLADRRGRTCYVVGAVLLTGAAIGSATAVYDSTQSQWVVNIDWANHDFISKIAEPLVNHEVAIVLGGVVESAPRINPGITGSEVEISGGYTRADAVRIAASILGIDPSRVPTSSSG